MDTILCDELLEEVLRRLPPRYTFSPFTSDVSLVSKRWLRLYRSSRSRLSLRLSPDNCTPPHSLSSFLSHFPHLPTLRIFTDNWNLDAELKLETLALCGIQRGDYGFDWLWKSSKNLKRLRLQGCEGIGDDTSVSSFVNCFKGLQEVELRRCGSIVNEILTRLVENCTSLNSLLIYHQGSKEGLLQFITHSRCNLQKLDLCLPVDLEDNHLLAMAEMFRGLSSLRLYSCFLVAAEGLRSMALAMSNKLEELALINCKVEPGLLTTLGQKFRNLRDLDLSELTVRGCKGLTNASVVSMFKSCKQLESINIMNCPGIDAEAVELFVLNCLQLKQIHVEESKLSNVSRSWASKRFIEVIV
ncbi:hypothetical protein C3L33_01633, partial [Rhododendron williamsianum]